MAARERVDAVVVGAGAGGSVAAAVLAEGGKRVLVLEAGPPWKAEDLISSNIWSRRLKWSGATVLKDGANPINHNFNSGLGFGGAALHQFAVWPRLHEEDFKIRSRYGKGLDWPIEYDDLRPYYDRIQKDVGISGDAKAEVWRPPGEPYPMPGVPLFRHGEILKRGFDALGLRTAPVPLAINSTEYQGRPACQWDGWCDAGCSIGALANPQTIFLPRAEKAGAELRPHARVTRVLTTPRGDRASGVEYVDAAGETIMVEADVVVLAAFAIQTPRILLNSVTDRHPEGLGNSSGLLGAYIMTHPGGSIYGLFDEKTDNNLGTVGGQLVCQDSYDGKNKGAAFGSYQWLIAQAQKPNDLLGLAMARPDVFGNDLHDFLKRSVRGLATMTAVCEDLAVAENKLQLTAKKDSFGVPLARVTHNTAAPSRALWRSAMDEGVRIMEAAGATEVWHSNQSGMHNIGGTVMGAEASASVTNSHGVLHDAPNVAIAGTGLLPSSGGVNPTFTLHALALRTGEHLLREWPA